MLKGKVVLNHKRLASQLLLARLEHYTNSKSKSLHDYRVFSTYANGVFLFKSTDAVLKKTGIWEEGLKKSLIFQDACDNYLDIQKEFKLG
jgi:hypothetical protein